MISVITPRRKSSKTLQSQKAEEVKKMLLILILGVLKLLYERWKLLASFWDSLRLMKMIMMSKSTTGNHFSVCNGEVQGFCNHQRTSYVCGSTTKNLYRMCAVALLQSERNI